MCRRMRFALSRIVSVVVAATAADAVCAQSPQASVALRITLDADAVEIIRAARRQQGIDPPDAAADARVAELLRVISERSRTTVPTPAVAARSSVHAKP